MCVADQLTFHDGVGNIDVTVGGKPFVAGRGGISSGGSSGPSGSSQTACAQLCTVSLTVSLWRFCLPPSLARCTVEEVVVIVTFPAGVAGADVSATVGTVTFPLEEQKKNVVR